MKTHRDLKVWKESIQLVSELYRVTNHFPGQEKWGLINQIRKASVSVPSNIAEGAARHSEKDFLRFLHISMGSLAELETQLIISKNLGYLDSKVFDNLFRQMNHIQKMLFGLIKKLRLP